MKITEAEAKSTDSRGGSVRPKLFDLIDREGWPLPAGLKLDESQGFFDLIVETDDMQAAM